MVSPTPLPPHSRAKASPSSSIPPNPNDTGMLKCQTGRCYPSTFSGVNAVLDFSTLLGTPLKAIPLVFPKTLLRVSKGYSHNAIEINQNHYPVHKRSCHPLPHERGGDLLCPEFLRFKAGGPSCDCDQTLCKSAGCFSSEPALCTPSSRINVATHTPGLFSSEKRQKFQVKKRKRIYLRSWHFFPHHQIKNEKGQWELDCKKREKKCSGLERHASDFPPLRATPRRFVDEEHFGDCVRPQDRWAEDNNETEEMPSWMMGMLAVDSDLVHSSNKGLK